VSNKLINASREPEPVHEDTLFRRSATDAALQDYK
jgi:hypothetical protein